MTTAPPRSDDSAEAGERMRTTPILLAWAIAASLAFGGVVFWHLTERSGGDGVVSQLRRLEDDRIRTRWTEALSHARYDHAGEPFEFPSVQIASPVLWDWYEHAVMRGDLTKRDQAWRLDWRLWDQIKAAAIEAAAGIR